MSSPSFNRVLCIDDFASPCRVAMAQTFAARAGGLLIRAPLQANESLWITQCGSIHTVGMRYAIDVVFLDRHGRVLRVAGDVRPWRMRIQPGAQSVVELQAGLARRHGIAEGCRLTTAECQPAPRHPDMQPSFT